MDGLDRVAKLAVDKRSARGIQTQGVGAIAAGDGVARLLPGLVDDDQVVAIIAIDQVGAGTTFDGVVAGAAIEGLRPGTLTVEVANDVEAGDVVGGNQGPVVGLDGGQRDRSTRTKADVLDAGERHVRQINRAARGVEFVGAIATVEAGRAVGFCRADHKHVVAVAAAQGVGVGAHDQGIGAGAADHADVAEVVLRDVELVGQ